MILGWLVNEVEVVEGEEKKEKSEEEKSKQKGLRLAVIRTTKRIAKHSLRDDSPGADITAPTTSRSFLSGG
jgi:hypothetical protein